ncbi:hypothetical protein [Sporosarcina sp.]|uniref:hypothetical protein n=1 Tax=Sporosarcina sp. TaxID=49982 RepID=UPI00345C1799
MKYNDTWDLEEVFAGGTNSEEVQTKISSIKEDIVHYANQLKEWNREPANDTTALQSILKQQEVIGKGLGQVATFVNMWRDAFMMMNMQVL